MNDELKRFVDMKGGYRAAGEALGVSAATVHCWYRLKHKIPPVKAKLIEELTDGELSAAVLVFGEAA